MNAALELGSTHNARLAEGLQKEFVKVLQKEPVELLVCHEVSPKAVLILAGLHGWVGLQGLGVAMLFSSHIAWHCTSC